MGFIIAIIYFFITLIVYTILRFVKTDEDSELHITYSVFWPVVIITLIILGPFYLIDILAKKIKRNKNNK